MQTAPGVGLAATTEGAAAMSSRERFQSKATRELGLWARAQGWTWRVCGSGHFRFEHSAVPAPVFTRATPRANGGHKERQKLQTALRRATEEHHA
jgi:hypothetical protein